MADARAEKLASFAEDLHRSGSLEVAIEAMEAERDEHQVAGNFEGLAVDLSRSCVKDEDGEGVRSELGGRRRRVTARARLARRADACGESLF